MTSGLGANCIWRCVIDLRFDQQCTNDCCANTCCCWKHFWHATRGERICVALFFFVPIQAIRFVSTFLCACVCTNLHWSVDWVLVICRQHSVTINTILKCLFSFLKICGWLCFFPVFSCLISFYRTTWWLKVAGSVVVWISFMPCHDAFNFVAENYAWHMHTNKWTYAHADRFSV